MNEIDYPTAQPPRLNYESISIEDLRKKIVDLLVNTLDFVNIFYNPGAIAVLNKGIKYDRYDPPQPVSIHDSENVVTNVVVDKKMGTLTPFSVGDDQPFPIYGSLTLQWG